ncbi:hypothetical protein Clacol_009448 [Clathrus columnatus]|uniref:Uncharacterized protein n=1 Tax=Clathrus columnatus TaxID=1419009 RepID=A0AAV5AQ54_9AGAM|nr:hypothetical protein Clacol_009448 [Clathrus columnatus]
MSQKQKTTTNKAAPSSSPFPVTSMRPPPTPRLSCIALPDVGMSINQPFTPSFKGNLPTPPSSPRLSNSSHLSSKRPHW